MICSGSKTLLARRTNHISTAFEAATSSIKTQQKVLVEPSLADEDSHMKTNLWAEKKNMILLSFWQTLHGGWRKAEKRTWPGLKLVEVCKQRKCWPAIAFDVCFQELSWCCERFLLSWTYMQRKEKGKNECFSNQLLNHSYCLIA